jgi:acyl carrier protein
VLSDGEVRRAEVEAWIEKREAILAGLRSILVRSLRVPLPPHAIDPDVMLFGTGLALDSIDALELVVAAEEAFGVDLPDPDVERGLRTLNSFVDLILAKQEKRA